MSSGLRLKLTIGCGRDFPFQAVNPDGSNATGVFESGDTLSTKVWAADGASINITTTWISATAGQFQVSFANSDTSGLPAGRYRIETTATRSGRSGQLLPSDSFIFLLAPPSSSTPTDLVTQDVLAAALGDVDLTTAQAEALPQLAAAASRAIRKHCNRWFNRRGPGSAAGLPAYDGLYTLDWPSRTVLLNQFPVNAIVAVRTDPTLVLTVSNTDAVTNQRATCALVLTGVEDITDVPPACSGISLYRMASGVATTNTLLFGTYVTLQALANAVIALGNGWTATVEDGYELWPTADLRAGQGPQPCLYADDDQVGFVIHVTDVGCQYDAKAGLITLSSDVGNPFSSPRWGAYLFSDVDDVEVNGGLQGVRVVYDAGWDVVPEEVQQACVETVLDMLSCQTLDQRLGSESDGARSIVLNTAFANYAFPKSVLGKLAPYVNHRA